MTGGTTFRIAWRNLWRNRRRTGLAMAAIGLSVALVLLYDGLLRWESDWLMQTVTGPMLGHVQLHAPEWRRTRAMDRTLQDAGTLAEELRRDPGVAAVATRVYAPALAALGEEGFGVMVVGLDMAQESGHARLLGEAGAPRLGNGRVLMGRTLAEQMGVFPGAEIAVVGQAIDGSLANDLYTVEALVDTPVDLINRQAILMPLDQAQQLFAMPGEAHELVVYARDAAQAEALAERVRTTLPPDAAEVLDWKTLAPSMVDLIELVEIAWIFVLGLVLLAASAGVANTMLMATFERTREFGMLLSLGTAPARIVAMILLESLVLGATGALLGSAIGGALVGWWHQTGIDYATLTGGGPGELTVLGMKWSLRIYPRLEWIDVARVIAAVTATSVLASAWPAVRAARLQPARALRG